MCSFYLILVIHIKSVHHLKGDMYVCMRTPIYWALKYEFIKEHTYHYGFGFNYDMVFLFLNECLIFQVD